MKDINNWRGIGSAVEGHSYRKKKWKKKWKKNESMTENECPNLG